MRDIAVTLTVLATLPFILKRPWIGILVWSWLSFMNPHRLCWGFATTLPFAQVVAITTMVAMLMSKEKYKIPWTRELVLIAALWIWMLVTTANALYPELAVDQLIKVSKILLMILVAAMLINTRERLMALVWVIALSLGFFGVKGGIFTISTGGAHRVRGPEGSFIDGNNEIGLALAMTVPLLFFLSRHAPKKFLSVGLLAAAMLTAFAALGTQSRGALLGIGAMATFLWLKSRRKIMTGILIALFIGLLLPLLPEEWYARMSTIKSYEQDPSAIGRINAWWMAYNLALDRLTGGGFESFIAPTFQRYAPSPSEIHDSHSIYFQVLGHHGFIGLAMFLALALCTWLTASSIIRTAKRDKELAWLRDLMAMVQVSLVAYLSAGAFLGLAYFDFFYNLVLIVAIGEVLRRRATGSYASTPERSRWGPRGGAAPVRTSSSAGSAKQ